MYDLELSLPQDAWFVTLKKMVSLCLLHQSIKDTSRFSIKDGWRDEWNIRAGDREVTQLTRHFLFKLQVWDQNAHVKNSDKVVCFCSLGWGERERRISRTYCLASLDSQWGPALIRDPVSKNTRNDWARHFTLTLGLYGHVYMLVHTPTNVHEHKTHT